MDEVRKPLPVLRWLYEDHFVLYPLLLKYIWPIWVCLMYTTCWFDQCVYCTLVANVVLASTSAAAASRQSCPTLCDPIDSSPPGSSVPGILQARTLEWVAISSSNAWKWKLKGKLLSRVQLLATPWTAAHQAPPSMGVSRQEYWSGVPVPSLS